MVGAVASTIMSSRTRTNGARVPSSGFETPPESQVTHSGTFQSPKDNFNRGSGSYPLTRGYGKYDDTRASITDETGSVGHVNSVDHDKIAVQFTLPSAQFVQNNPEAPFGVATTVLHGSTVPYYLDLETASLPPTVPDGAAIALARVPTLSPEVMSGLNSLYELKDTRAFLELIPVHFLWAAARAKRRESVKALNRWLSGIRRTARSPLQCLQALAGADLMWKFGVKPLLSDINAVHDSLNTYNAQVARLLAERFVSVGRFSDSASNAYTNVSGVSSDTLGYFAREVTTSRTVNKTWVYGARKRIDPVRLPHIDVTKFRYLAERLGVGFDATDVWEAIPYSFVLDWFLPIQSFVESLARAKPDPSWLLTDGAWSSVKTEDHGHVSEVIQPLSGANCSVSSSSGLNRLGSFTKTAYTRTRLSSLPSGLPNIYIPRPRLPEKASTWLTGLEMLVQRIPRTLK